MRRGASLSAAAAALALTLSWMAGFAHAHSGATTGFAAIRIEGETVLYTLSLPIEAADAARAAASAPEKATQAAGDPLAAVVSRYVAVVADGASCAPAPRLVQPAAPGHATVVVVVQYVCPTAPRSLSLDDRLFLALGRDHHTIANVEWTGGSQQLVFDPERPQAVVSIAGASLRAYPARVSGAAAFFQFGIEHIVTGFDHILFLVALILGGGSLKALLGIVTAFTVAHSTTLALAVFDVARPPGGLIEPLIALSIAVVAVENLVAGQAPLRRALASFLFGLVHGFGFAGALVELQLPTKTLVPSLLFFNFGVEVGQAIIVALLLPFLSWSSRLFGQRRVIGSVSAVVLTAALALFVGRL